MRPRTSTSAFGLVAWLEQTQIHLPLKAIECRFEASGPAVDVQIDQIFHQSATRPLDVIYSFPLPSKAAVYRCEMIVNGHMVRAKVLEQEAARRVAALKKAEGRRTALVEMDRRNLFTLSLGNVQPGDAIVIRFAYVEELDAWKDEMALQIPFTPGVRYIPGKPLLRSNSGKGAVDDTDQVADASRISPPRINQMHPDAAALSLLGKLDGRDVDLSSISSPTHPTAVRPAGNDLEIFLPSNAAIPDRDFVLRWRRAIHPELLPVAWLSSDRENTYALIQLRAPDDAPNEILEGNDIYFLVDRSGSMTGDKWTRTAEALIAFVKATARQDRVWITFFESDYRDFAEKPMERDALLRDPNFSSVAELGTGGGTELLPALRHLLAVHQRFSAQRRSHIVLITDGQIGNEEAVLEEVAGRDVPVHCFGIDHAVNEGFLRQLSGQQRGTSAFLTPDDDLIRSVAILGSRLGKPVVTGLFVAGSWELADSELPDIHAGQVVFAPIRAKGVPSEITVVGKDGDGQSVALQLQGQLADTDLPRLIWMRHRIDSLLQDRRSEQAIELAKEANLVCRGAAFVAWDEAENVAVAQDEVYQPSLQFMRAKSIVFASICEGDVPELSEPVPPPCSAQPRLRETFSSRETKGLIKQLRRTIQSAFGRADARKLVSIALDWAKHTDLQQVWQALWIVLKECRRNADAAYLRKVLSAFFLALPERWRSEAASVFAKLERQPEPNERSWRSFLRFP